MELAIKKLSQKEAEDLRRVLSEEVIKMIDEAFKEEERNLPHYGWWALPPDKRIYYLVSLNGIPYLLVGINPNPAPTMIYISSFSRVTQELKGRAPICLGRLIEDKLIPFCREQGKDSIKTRVTTEKGRRVLESLRTNLPRGVAEIRAGRHGVYTIRLAEEKSTPPNDSF